MIFSVDLSIQQINREVRSSKIVGLYEVMVMAGELVEFEEDEIDKSNSLIR